MDFGNIINNLLNQMAFFHLGAGNYVMIVVALVFLYLAIRKGFEPLLLIPCRRTLTGWRRNKQSRYPAVRQLP